MFLVFNKPEAENDLAQVVLWYESRQKGLGIRFLDHIEKLYTILETNPYLYTEKYPKVRQDPFSTFPLCCSIQNRRTKRICPGCF
jgi:hypothetical protein